MATGVDNGDSESASPKSDTEWLLDNLINEENGDNIANQPNDSPSTSEVQNFFEEVKFMDPKFYRAAKTGDIRCIREAMENDAESSILDQETPQKNTVLHLAVSSGHDQLVRMILDKRRDLIMKKNSMGDLPIHVAATTDNLSIVEFLVEKSKDMLKEKNYRSDTPLHIALQNGQKSVAKFLIESYPEMSHCLNEGKVSPLHMAAEYGHLELVKTMLEKAAHFPPHVSVAFAALEKENTDVLDEVLSKHSTLIDSKTEKGRTPLSHAAFIGNLAGVRYILKKSTKSVYENEGDENGNGNHYFPIHIASSRGHVDIIKEIIRHCPDSLELLSFRLKENLLHVAAKNGKANVVAYALKTPEFKNLLNQRDKNENTPLHLATMHWHPKIVRALTLDERVGLNLLNNQQMTALDIAENNTEDTSSFRKYLTRVALLSAGALETSLPRTISPAPSSATSDSSPDEKYKDKVNTLLLVSTLVATVTFAAGFTMPGGYNDSDPHKGMAAMVGSRIFHLFLICNTLAMYSSIIVVIILIWAQLGDLNLIETTFKWALRLLGVALSMMSLAFMAGAHVAVSHSTWLATAVWIIGSIFLAIALLLFVPLNNPATSKYPISRVIWYYSFNLMVWASRRGNDD